MITLVAVTGLYYDVEGHKKAIKKSCEGIEFGAVKIIMDNKVKNIDDWNKAIFYDLGNYIQTDYALLIHDNGFVVNPESWNPKWLEYDYCGSPFPLPNELDKVSYRDYNGKVQRVGNSVGLRSKKLLDLPKRLNLEWKSFHGYFNEDGAVSVNYRHIFEANGCKYMSFE